MSSEKAIFRGRYLEFFRASCGWEYVSRIGSSGGITIVAITQERRLLLVEQNRAPLKGIAIELPAGLVDIGEDELAAVKRELAEETGYHCADVRLLCIGATSPGLTDEKNSVYFASGLIPIPGAPDDFPGEDGSIRRAIVRGVADEGERITVHEVPVNGVLPWLSRQRERGAVVDLKVYAGLFFAMSQ